MSPEMTVTVAGGRPCAPVATSVSSRSNRVNDSPNAAQCSRSAARRSPLPLAGPLPGSLPSPLPLPSPLTLPPALCPDERERSERERDDPFHDTFSH